MVARAITITEKGQVTIPAEVRRALGLSKGDRLTVEHSGDSIILRRATSVTERTAGIFAAYRRDVPLTIEEEKEAFEMAVAEEVVESMNR